MTVVISPLIVFEYGHVVQMETFNVFSSKGINKLDGWILHTWM